jgi:pimeloyl-ACP methyl ester carboxylesterase
MAARGCRVAASVNRNQSCNLCLHLTFDHRSVRLQGREVAYVVGGDGPTVLLIHGIGGDWRTWEPVLDGLARQHRVVAVDLPGHGGSAKGAGDYSLGALASALRDLGGALGIERATVVGHSLGGGVAMQFAYQFPERCERLVLVSSGGLGPDVGLVLRLATLPGSELFLLLTAPAARSLINLAASAGRALGIRPAADAEFYARTFATLADPETRAAFLGTLRGVVGTRGQLVDARDRLYLAEHMPTLIVWGEHDAVLPVDHGHAAQEAMPGIRLEIFKDAGPPSSTTRCASSTPSRTSWRAPTPPHSPPSAGRSSCASTENASKSDVAGDRRWMTLADSQQQRMLERLRRAGDQPIALAELRATGIDFPGAVLSELELNGYTIERVHDHGRLLGVRLLEPKPPDTSPAHPRHRWPWRTGGKRRTT